MTTTPELRTEALAILDRFCQIVDNDMLVRGEYVEAGVSRPDLADAGAICGGHRACAIGALWIAGGHKPEATDHYSTWYSIFRFEIRAEYLAQRPALELAHTALVAAAIEYADRHDYELTGEFSDPLEDLFEAARSRENERIDPRKLLAVAALARTTIEHA